MSEQGEQSAEIDQGLEMMKQHMRPGEVWITNAVDAEAVKKGETIMREGEETGQALADRLAGYADKGGKWQSVRTVDHAYDRQGNTVKHMIALVGTPKEG